MSTNPYVERIAEEMTVEIGNKYGPTTLPAGVLQALAEYVIREYFEPKNKQIHDLHARVALLQASVDSLGKVLARHNAGACKEGESPIDCAKRLLSPVRDDTPARDRP